MIFSCFFVSVFGDGIFIDLWWNMGPIWCQEACAGRFILTRFSSFFRRVYFRLFLCCFRSYFDTLFVDLDCISCRFGLHFGTLLAGLGFFPSVLAPGALPERSWKPSTTPVGFLMICCWILPSNSMHMSYTLHATRWISDDLVLDFHIEFSVYVIQFKNMYGQSFFDSASMPVLLRSAAQRSALQLLRSAVFQNNMFWVSWVHKFIDLR